MRTGATRPGSFRLAACMAGLALLAAGCNPPARGADATREGEDVAERCARGHVLGPDGCMPVGIQGCADLFVEDDGLCHPAMAKCPPGTIPKFDEGCIAVGIPRCAPEFVGDDGLCRPTMAKCPTGTFATPDAGCVTVDGPDGCGSGPWGNIPRGPGNLYVDPSYSGEDSDGSEERPLTTLSAALELVAEGGTIALAEGTYDEPVVITRSLAVVGRCAARVRVRGVSSIVHPPAIVSVLDAGEVTLRGIALGGEGAGVVATGATAVALERVHIRSAVHAGVVASGGARLSIAQSWIDGTRPGAAGAGVGALAESGGAVSVKESAVTGNQAAGVSAAHARTTVAVVGSLIEGTAPSEHLGDGQGLVVRDGAEASIERTALIGNRLSGIFATTGASARVSGALVEGTNPGPDGLTYGVGVYAALRSRVAVDASVVLRNAEVGVAAIGVDTAAEVTRSLIQGTVGAAPASPLGGVGVAVARGATLHLRDSAVWKNRASGVHVADLSAELIAEGNLIEGTFAEGVWGGGAGVSVVDGRATLASNAIRDNEGAGLSVGYLGSEAKVTGNLVEGHVAPDRSLPVGQGIVIYQGARAVLAGNAVSGNRSVGVLLFAERPDGEVEITGDLVQDTAGADGDDRAGIGVAAVNYKLRLTSSLLRTSRTAGLALFSAEAEVSRALVDGVLGDRRAAEGERRDDVVADGVLAIAGSTAVLTDVRVTGCARAGILYDRSSGRLSRVRASGNLFGLVVQGSEAPDVGKGSVFVDNRAADELIGGGLRVPLSAPPLL
ncbi:nuclease [Sorangium cellulosum]|uniref:Nuclease n=1 Tax=Sorangium cellulosum TaxID=56 RepID=A0A4V0NDQ8_SORCE|nr:right-handed parallel beta-helix repeat-containing protein [Sorangium cellulosum]AUX23522.1 nuclease [Sorangium cellulosum]